MRERVREQELRLQLVEYGNKLVESGLVQGTWGNLSVRLDDQYMLVTPSGLDYSRLSAEDMVKVHIETLTYEGSLKPTSEKNLHSAIYHTRPEVSAVIHTHSRFCSVFAAARKPVPVKDLKMQEVFGDEIPIAEYALPGTELLRDHTVAALGQGAGCLMAAHGMICCGGSMEEAFTRCLQMEACCQRFLENAGMSGCQCDQRASAEGMSIEEVARRQRDFFHKGKSRDLTYRKKALRRLRGMLRAREDEILDALYQDLGKSRYEAYATELGMVYEEIDYMLKHMGRMAKPRKASAGLANFPARGKVYREPYGSVLIIAPWNYPLQLTLTPLVGALAAGNCAVVKPSAYAPHVSAAIKSILEACFSADYVYTVTGGREANQALLKQKFDYIFFTGGKTVGRQVMEAAAKHLTPVTLELGGKSPCIVDETANIPLAARRIVWGKFLNCGQTCVAPDYVIVHHAVKKKLIDAMYRNIEALYGENPLESKDYGKIINEKHFDRLCGLLQAENLNTSYRTDRNRLKIAPVIIEDAHWCSPVMEEEIFGPVLPVITYGNLSSVKREIEKRPRPLALYLFSRSRKNMRYVTSRLSYGGGCMNDTIMHLASVELPFGGVGESGMGSYHGEYSFETFTHEKSVLTKSTYIDLPMRYPPYSKSLRMLRAFLG
ncbi:aldehyde dehydrogenase family protein [Ihubacter sp. mB4P-1]|uniref:aldehyde dehydrogenase family protein n=1 Tax=Ihubacter sp. mB4P-1 TaxID=3242370 RepID=UPI003C7C4031